MKLHTILRDVTLIIVVLTCALLSLGGSEVCRGDATTRPGDFGATSATSEPRAGSELASRGGQLGMFSMGFGGQLG